MLRSFDLWVCWACGLFVGFGGPFLFRVYLGAVYVVIILLLNGFKFITFY